MKRFRLIIDTERCKGCELCTDVCPRRFLVMAHSMNARGNHVPEIVADSECTGCRQCAVICPDACLEIEMIDEAE